VIKGTAVNNDGAQKVGYLARSVDGQAACIAEALAVANVDANTVDYVECHGTGTPMGDPIEVAALSHAFRGSTDRTGYCRIGSVKSNIGHLDMAAGVASLIKVALSLQHRELPASLNFECNNPSLALETSPFVVNSTLTEWTKALDTPGEPVLIRSVSAAPTRLRFSKRCRLVPRRLGPLTGGGSSRSRAAIALPSMQTRRDWPPI